MDTRTEKSFDFASEVSKQLITLATAALTVTITFQKELVGRPSRGDLWVLLSAWMIFLISVVFGVLTHMSIAGELGANNSSAPSIYRGNIRLFAALQVLFFLLGTLVMILFGYFGVQMSSVA